MTGIWEYPFESIEASGLIIRQQNFELPETAVPYAMFQAFKKPSKRGLFLGYKESVCSLKRRLLVRFADGHGEGYVRCVGRMGHVEYDAFWEFSSLNLCALDWLKTHPSTLSVRIVLGKTSHIALQSVQGWPWSSGMFLS